MDSNLVNRLLKYGSHRYCIHFTLDDSSLIQAVLTAIEETLDVRHVVRIDCQLLQLLLRFSFA